MASVSYIDERDASGTVAEIYADIRKTFGIPVVPNMFKVMAHNPAYLQASWGRVKAVMGPGLLDRRTKEMIAVAVSATNGCDYCVRAHTGTCGARSSCNTPGCAALENTTRTSGRSPAMRSTSRSRPSSSTAPGCAAACWRLSRAVVQSFRPAAGGHPGLAGRADRYPCRTPP